MSAPNFYAVAAVAIDDRRVAFDELLVRLDAFYEERDWRRFQTLKELAASMSIEAAELQELFLWREDEGAVLSERRADVEDEVADILINLLNFARGAGVDVVRAALGKLERLERRYEANAVRGRVVAKVRDE